MTQLLAKFHAHMDSLPLVAILRGLKPEEALDVGHAIVNAGFHILEVPLNSPDPMRSIQILAEAFPNALVGAGTVTTAQQVRDIKAAGGQLIISPHLDDNVVCETVQRTKGLEYDAVILATTSTTVRDSLLYVGASRAVSLLTVIAPVEIGQKLGLTE